MFIRRPGETDGQAVTRPLTSSQLLYRERKRAAGWGRETLQSWTSYGPWYLTTDASKVTEWGAAQLTVNRYLRNDTVTGVVGGHSDIVTSEGLGADVIEDGSPVPLYWCCIPIEKYLDRRGVEVRVYRRNYTSNIRHPVTRERALPGGGIGRIAVCDQ